MKTGPTTNEESVKCTQHKRVLVGAGGDLHLTRQVTLRQLSEAIGVDKSTISRVLSGRYVRCSDETRRLIVDTANRLNYRPNLAARSLSGGRTRAIGLIAPLMHFEIDHIEKVCREADYGLNVVGIRNDPDAQADAMMAFRQRGVEGILLVRPVAGCDLISRLQAAGFPLTISHYGPTVYPTVDTFHVDLESGTRLLVDHLTGLGHRRIAAVINHNLAYASCSARYQGWKTGLEAVGVAPDESWLINLNLKPAEYYWHVYQHGYEAGVEFMRRFGKTDPARPTAVYASVDEVAVGVATAFAEGGWSVPQDVSVVGMQNLEVGRYRETPITTVDLHHRDSYRESIKHLILLIEETSGDTPRPLHHTFRADLIVRKSSAAPPF